jgi:hypothetical protein
VKRYHLSVEWLTLSRLGLGSFFALSVNRWAGRLRRSAFTCNDFIWLCLRRLLKKPSICGRMNQQHVVDSRPAARQWSTAYVHPHRRPSRHFSSPAQGEEVGLQPDPHRQPAHRTGGYGIKVAGGGVTGLNNRFRLLELGSTEAPTTQD